MAPDTSTTTTGEKARENSFRIDGLTMRIETLEVDRRQSNELLIRIDERIKILGEDIKGFKEGFVTKQEFEPIKKFVYGAIALALTSVGGVILSLALK